MFDPALGLLIHPEIFRQAFIETDDEYPPVNSLVRPLERQPSGFAMTVGEISSFSAGSLADALDPEMPTFEIVEGDLFSERAAFIDLDGAAIVAPPGGFDLSASGHERV